MKKYFSELDMNHYVLSKEYLIKSDIDYCVLSTVLDLLDNLKDIQKIEKDVFENRTETMIKILLEAKETLEGKSKEWEEYKKEEL